MIIKKKLCAIVAIALGVSGVAAYGAVRLADNNNIVIRFGTIEHNGVTSGDIIDSLYDIIIQESNIDNTDKIKVLTNNGVLSTLGIYGEFTDDVYIDREMLSNCITYIANLYSKNNTPIDFINTKLDAIKYDNTNYVVYNNLMDNGTDYFDGETVPTVDETLEILANFKSLLANTPIIENSSTNSETSVLNLDTVELDIPTEVIDNANKNLKDKQYSTIYNSVAIHSEPRSIYDLQDNINKLNIGDAYSSSNNYNFIGIDEGLWDYSLIDFDLVEEVENPDEVKEALMPKYIARCNLPNGVGINHKDNKTILYHPNFNNMGILNAEDNLVYYISDAYLIDNNSVIERGSYYLSSDGKIEIEFSTNNLDKADYIGLITEMNKLSTTGGYDRVLVLFNTNNLNL